MSQLKSRNSTHRGISFNMANLNLYRTSIKLNFNIKESVSYVKSTRNGGKYNDESSGVPRVTRLKICNRILEMNLLTRYLSFITNGNHMPITC